jgi:hypothetical protein
VDSDLLPHHHEIAYATPKVKEANKIAKKPSITTTLENQFMTLGGVACAQSKDKY